MAKARLMRMSTVEKLLRSLGHGEAADSIAQKARRERDFKLQGKDIRRIERGVAAGKTLQIRRFGERKLAFKEVEVKRGFQHPHILKAAMRAKALA